MTTSSWNLKSYPGLSIDPVGFLTSRLASLSRRRTYTVSTLFPERSLAAMPVPMFLGTANHRIYRPEADVPQPQLPLERSMASNARREYLLNYAAPARIRDGCRTWGLPGVHWCPTDVIVWGKGAFVISEQSSKELFISYPPGHNLPCTMGPSSTPTEAKREKEEGVGTFRTEEVFGASTIYSLPRCQSRFTESTWTWSSSTTGVLNALVLSIPKCQREGRVSSPRLPFQRAQCNTFVELKAAICAAQLSPRRVLAGPARHSTYTHSDTCRCQYIRSAPQSSTCSIRTHACPCSIYW